MCFLIPPETRRVGLTLSIIAALFFAAPPSILAEAGGQGSNELPSALIGDFDGQTIPQSEEDLERTRDAKYGRVLTAAQHQEIQSWRVFAPEWWLDPVRESAAVQKQQSLRQLFQDRTSGETLQALRTSDQTFGIEVVNPPDATQEIFHTVVRIEGRMRPDLLSVDKETVAFAVRYVQLEASEQAGFFKQVLRRSVQCDSVDDGAALSFNDICGYTSAEVSAMQRDFGIAMSNTVDHMRANLDSRLGSFLGKFHATHSANRGASLDLATYKEADRGALDIMAEVYAEAAAICRDSAPSLLLPGLLDMVTEGMRNQTILMSLPAEELVIQELDLLREFITAQQTP